MLPPLHQTRNLKYKSQLIAEAFFFGQILGGSNFNTPDGIFCQMTLQAGDRWNLIAPAREKYYQTQTSYAEQPDSFIWAHPFDFHFQVKDLTGWPKATLNIWRFNDSSSTAQILAYGIFNFPKTSGCHQIECQTWTPYGDWKYSALANFLETHPRITDISSISNHEEQRSKLFTIGSGKVQIEVNVLLRNFKKLNVTN